MLEKEKLRILSKKLLIVAGPALVFGLIAAAAPIILKFRKISHTIALYSFDKAVFESTINLVQSQGEKISTEQYLNPSWLKHYGMDMASYIDEKGHFSPSGLHWKEWSLETRTIALLMWKPEVFTTAWRVYFGIRQIDTYYKYRDKTTPVIHVVNAVGDEI